MILPGDVALDLAIAKASLILILTLAILAYLMRIAMKVTSGKSAPLRVPPVPGSKPTRSRGKRSTFLFWRPF